MTVINLFHPSDADPGDAHPFDVPPPVRLCECGRPVRGGGRWCSSRCADFELGHDLEARYEREDA